MDVLVGVVGAAHALKGEVYLDVRTDSPEERFFEGAVLRKEGGGSLTVKSLRVHKGRLVVRFEEVSDRNGAEAIRGTRLVIDSAEVEEEEDAWYPHELVGMDVRTVDGEPRGTLKDFIPGAAQDLLVVEWEGREVLVPFVYEIVPEVLEDERVILIDPPGGLFDDEEA
ncbi:MAG: ribosome maturation factor RimM [Actinomycetaceae bacterium]|nr:ribosome maturation factor RimM [Actinomycetaceae bacterium]